MYVCDAHVCMCVHVCTHVCGYVYLCEYICMCRPVARSENKGVRKTNVDLTSGRWPRWVARYEKGGWAVHFRADIRKVGGAICFRSITKSGGGGGGGQFASGPLRKVGGGGGGGGQFASGPLRKVGGGGGGGQFASGPLRKVGGGQFTEASQAGTCTT